MTKEAVAIVMPRLNGKPFYCSCSCNVFTKVNYPDYDYVIRCNACGTEYVGEEVTLYTRTRPTCPRHPDQIVTHEIEGRVLVCKECASDQELLDYAKENWR